ncbi:HalOD1 output domain-containing protein [Haloplanus sp. C73]|uniref:HalOD1 output domain-containing protein n=1 Tax=Haloplanus sp. C73 TaxID=3421641 RepID=UPI003EBB15BF
MSATGEENATAVSVPHRVDIDWERREPVSSAIQTALSDVENSAAVELDPLADYVDPDALEAFFSGTDDAARNLSFAYGDYTVYVDGAGYVRID